MTPPRPAVEFRDCHKGFIQGGRSVEALRGVTLTVPPGQFLAITGPSGSGKSTLLNLACGIDVPDSGEVLVDGRALAGLPDRELTRLRLHHFGMVFQFFNLIPTLTALENIVLPAALAGVSTRDARHRAGELLDRLGLPDKAGQRPDTLSGGEQQRVALARALVNNPRIIPADEPTGNLDSDSGRVVLHHLRELSREDGRTVLMVTHSPDALAYADATVRIRDGHLLPSETDSP